MRKMIGDVARLARSAGDWRQAKARSKARTVLGLAVHDAIKAALGKASGEPVGASEPIGLGQETDPVIVLAERLSVRHGWNRPTAMVLAQAS